MLVVALMYNFLKLLFSDISKKNISVSTSNSLTSNYLPPFDLGNSEETDFSWKMNVSPSYIFESDFGNSPAFLFQRHTKLIFILLAIT